MSTLKPCVPRWQNCKATRIRHVAKSEALAKESRWQDLLLAGSIICVQMSSGRVQFFFQSLRSALSPTLLLELCSFTLCSFPLFPSRGPLFSSFLQPPFNLHPHCLSSPMLQEKVYKADMLLERNARCSSSGARELRGKVRVQRSQGNTILAEFPPFYLGIASPLFFSFYCSQLVQLIPSCNHYILLSVGHITHRFSWS